MRNFNCKEIFLIPFQEMRNFKYEEMIACSFWKTRGLIWADILARYVLWSLMIYMTDEWKFSSTRAAAIVNVFWAITEMMSFVMRFFMDAFLVYHHWMALFSAVLYSFGLCLLSTSIMKNWKIAFFISLVTVSGGISSSMSVSLDELSEERERELPERESPMREQKKLPKYLDYLSKCVLISAHLFGAIAFTYLDLSYALMFWIPAICMVVATLVFLTGLSSYKCIQGERSRPTTIFKNACCWFQNWGRNDLPSGNVEDHEQQRNDRSERRGKFRKRRFLVCVTFFFLGVVSAIGETYFIEQANTMNSKHGPSPRQLQLLYYFAKFMFSQIYKQIVKRTNNDRRTYAGCAGVSVSMAFGIFCCFTAARMEIRRLSRLKRHIILVDESDHNNTITNMNTFWLLPQYVFLGGLDGISKNSIDLVFSNNPPQAMDPYMIHLANGFFGFGNIGSVLSIFIAGKASAWKDGTSWFGETLDESRLDKYYLVLGVVAAVNFICYIILYYWHGIWKVMCQIAGIRSRGEAVHV